jgi:hypothetical protein
MSGELDEAFARMKRFDRLDMLLRQILDYLDRRQQPDAPLHLKDVPLHERGFGVMDEDVA